MEDINIIGNDHTQKNVILREIHHPIPSEFDTTLAVKDRARIYNLGLFSTVEIDQIDSSYTVFVIETFRLLPIPLLEYEEGQGFSFGAGMAYLNLRGLNEKLIIGGINGMETTYFFDFIDPWVYGNHGSVIVNTYQYYAESAVYNYSYQERAFFIGTGFYMGNNHKFKSQLGYEVITLKSTSSQLDKDEKDQVGNLEPKHNYIQGMLFYEYDTRNIYIDPTRGTRFTLKLRPKLGFNSTPNRLNLELSFKQYIELQNWILDPVISIKSLILIKSTKDLPVFENEYLGGEGFVRGYSPIVQKNPIEIQSKIEGSQIIYESLQLQHTLIKRRDFSGMEVGIDLVYFTDIGISSNHMNLFQLSDLIYGYGFGLRFFASGLGVISLDFGYNPYGSWFIHPADGNY